MAHIDRDLSHYEANRDDLSYSKQLLDSDFATKYYVVIQAPSFL